MFAETGATQGQPTRHDGPCQDNGREGTSESEEPPGSSTYAGIDAAGAPHSCPSGEPPAGQRGHATTDVRRRCVFYVSGFDPKGASHYHGLYQRESTAQQALNGLRVEVGPRRRDGDGNSFWEIEAEREQGERAHTRYVFLRWDDIVRAHWPRGRYAYWRAVMAASAFNLRHGSLWRMFLRSWPSAMVLIAPILLLAGTALGTAAALSCALLAVRAELLSPWAASCGVLAACAALALANRAAGRRWYMDWLMYSYAFTARQACGQVPALDERLDAHAHAVARRIAAGEEDEILVVGHSSGSIMAASILARALRQAAPDPAWPGTLGLLTLGQCIPMLALVPQARAFREELALLASHPARLTWIDFSAPGDICCSALCDPLDLADVERSATPRVARQPHRPKLLSPRFPRAFSRERYQALRRDRFRMHFQYLMSAEQPTEYDYFAITAGARRLEARYAHLNSVLNYTGLRPFARWNTRPVPNDNPTPPWPSSQ